MRTFNVKVNGTSYFVEVEEGEFGQIPAPVKQEKPAAPKPVTAGGAKVLAPLPGLVLNTTVADGTPVKKGDKVLVLEAMKMEHDILAGADGKITFAVRKGDSVTASTVLATIQ